MTDRSRDPIEALSYDEEYAIEMHIEFEDAPITLTYPRCGAHAIDAAGKIRLTEAKRLLAVLEALPGIRGEGD